MLTKTRIALAAALILGTASAALAGDINTDPRESVLPGSLDGVNPADHPGIFRNPATARSYGFIQSSDGTWHVQDQARQ